MIHCDSYDPSSARVSGTDGTDQEAVLALPPGIDSSPLPGDICIQGSDGPGDGCCVAALDESAAKSRKAAPGEFRCYARNAAGVLVAEFHMQASGDIKVKSLLGTAVDIEAPLAAVSVTAAALTINAASTVVNGALTVSGPLTAAAVSATAVATPALTLGAVNMATFATSHKHNYTDASGATVPTGAPNP